jgi:hypothetical protein
MAIKYIRILHSKALKLGFLGCEFTIWQPCCCALEM